MKNFKNIDSFGHVRGESLFIDDIIVRQDTLYGLVFDSPKAHGIIKKLDITKAASIEGVIKIFTYKDIPGENQIGGIIPDEPLLAEKEVHFIGQPIAFIVARSEKIAKKARALIEVEIDDLPVITKAKEAASKDLFISEPRTFKLGNTQDAFGEMRLCI